MLQRSNSFDAAAKVSTRAHVEKDYFVAKAAQATKTASQCAGHLAAARKAQAEARAVWVFPSNMTVEVSTDSTAPDQPSIEDDGWRRSSRLGLIGNTAEAEL
eukprot:7343985-Prymnesium_polylepis.1